MNILKKIIYAVPVVAVMLAASCAKDSTSTPTEGDVADCYNVYFPDQENLGDIEVEAEEVLPKTYTYTACRTNAEDDITVPVVLAENTDDMFVVSPIKFAAGEKTAQFTVTLTDKAELGVKYALKLKIDDPKYAPMYSGLNPTKHNPQLDVEVMRAHWVEVSSGTFSSDLNNGTKFAGLKVMQKEKTDDYKIVNFIGTGKDMVFTWDPDTNKCDIGRQESGFVLQGLDLNIMDFRTFYIEFFGVTYDWDLFESVGYTQSYYDPDKRMFTFNLMYIDIATGYGLGPLEDKFIFKGGSFGCELSLMLLSPTRFVSTSKPIDSGTVAAYPESEYMGWQIAAPSRNIKSIKFVIIPTLAYDYPESELGMSLNDYVDNYGITGDQEISSDGTTILDRLNSEDEDYGGWFANISSGLNPDTSYTMYAKAENDRGETDEFVAEYTTGKPGTYYKMSYLPNGEEEPFEVTFRLETNVITNSNTGAKTPIYYIKNLGAEDGTIWHAAYNADSSTLSIPGYVVGFEEYGCLFSQIYGYINEEKTLAYAFLSIDPANEASEGADPCVFAINGEGKIASLKTTLSVPVYNMTGTQPSLAGYWGYYPAGTAVTVTEAPSEADSETTSMLKIKNADIPFCSISGTDVLKSRKTETGFIPMSVKQQKRVIDFKPLKDYKKLVAPDKERL